MASSFVKRVQLATTLLGVSLLVAAGAGVGASAAGLRVSGGTSMAPGGFGIHAAVWVDPFLQPNLSGRFGGEYWQAWGWRYIGGDASALYKVELARDLQSPSAWISSLRPYVGGGLVLGLWSSSAKFSSNGGVTARFAEVLIAQTHNQAYEKATAGAW